MPLAIFADRLPYGGNIPPLLYMTENGCYRFDRVLSNPYNDTVYTQ